MFPLVYLPFRSLRDSISSKLPVLAPHFHYHPRPFTLTLHTRSLHPTAHMPAKRRGRPPAPGHAAKKGRTTTSSELPGVTDDDPDSAAIPTLEPATVKEEDPLRAPHPF